MRKHLFVAVLSALLLLPGAASASSSGVVVSQLYGGGGNSGAAFKNDFVELFNAGASPVDVSGWTVQYATATGTSWQATALSGTIAAGAYYLVQLASGGTNGSALPTPDATGTSNLAASGGKVALVRGTTPLTCGGSAGSCSSSTLVEDLAGYGSASDFEGSGSAPAPSATLSAQRAGSGCTDTGDNAVDFATAAPSPRNSASPTNTCSGAPPTGGGGTVAVDVDLSSVLVVSLDHTSLSFGTTAAGATPAPLPTNLTVSTNNALGYSVGVARTAFSPRDLPLALAASAPASATLGSPFAGGSLVPIPIQPAPVVTVGTKSAPSAAGGDVWPTRVGFSSPLPVVPSGRYTATVTFTVLAQ